MATKRILLLKMFAGGFNVENVGHEIINYYLPDDSEEYHIFVPPHGKVNASNIDNIMILEKTSLSYILKVVAIIKEPEIDKDDFANVKYDQKPLNEIVFGDPESEIDDDSVTLSTFKCKKDNYYKTRDSGIYLIPACMSDGPFDDGKRKELINLFNKEKQGTLIEMSETKPWHNISYVKDSSPDYQVLDNIIKNAKNKGDHDCASRTLDGFEYTQDNLLKYISKEYDENAITSFFHSLLNEKRELAKDFINFITGSSEKTSEMEIKDLRKQKLALTKGQALVNKYLKASKNGKKSMEVHKKDLEKMYIKNELSPDEINRFENPSTEEPFERGIIDLFIETDKSVIAIENKIKSGLNGKTVDADGEETTQLSKYDRYLQSAYNNKKRFLFVFAPDYNSEFKIDQNINATFKTIRYSELRDFFKKKLSNESQVGGVWENKYRLFLNTLEKHSIRLEDEMLIRFKNAIKS